LAKLAQARLRLWRFDGRGLRLAFGDDPGWQPPVPKTGGRIPVLEHGWIWLQAVPGSNGFWLEVDPDGPRPVETLAPKLAEVVGAFLASQHDLGRITEELADRYQEIDLLYTISELLGQKISFRETAKNILREVSTMVSARRASILVHDEASGLLDIAATWGVRPEQLTPVTADDPLSIAARVFREERMVVVSAEDAHVLVHEDERTYRGRAFLCVPVSYAAPGTRSRCVGVMSFTDRLGTDEFSAGDQKLVAAVANQVGAAIENDRLTLLDIRQQRVQQELSLAHDLQLKLMPTPSVLGDRADLAVRCHPAEQVGGDFYTFGQLRGDHIGVMLGDVSSHGFSAALVMALVLSAAAIHTGTNGSPDEILDALHRSLSLKLDSTEMYFTVFYGILSRAAGEITYASAGHQHAFKIPREGDPVRLATTAPPLGLVEPGSIGCSHVDWDVDNDLLCLWTDGLVEARNADGEAYSERRLLDVMGRCRSERPEAIVQEVFDDLDNFGARYRDDRTLLVLRL
jgi:sigma-B regulation protein RsbU (phosphoserine phosphatase)